jgi:hypothetical protein
VDSLYHPYVRPQENGQWADLLWMTLTDRGGRGLVVSGPVPLDMTALPSYQLPYGEYRYRWVLRGVGPDDHPAELARRQQVTD